MLYCIYYHHLLIELAKRGGERGLLFSLSLKKKELFPVFNPLGEKIGK